MAFPVTGKRLELLRQMVPTAELIAVLQDPTFAEHQTETGLIETATHNLGQKIVTFEARSEQEIDAAFSTIAKSGAGALFTGAGQFLNSRRNQLVGLAALHGIPASYVLSTAGKGCINFLFTPSFEGDDLLSKVVCCRLLLGQSQFDVVQTLGPAGRR